MNFRAITTSSAITLAVLAVAAPVTWNSMSVEDIEHEQFSTNGKSVKGFLKEYCNTIKASYSDEASLASFLSDDYSAPSRGTYEFQPGGTEGDVIVLNLTAVGDTTLTKDQRVQELQEYFNEVSDVQEAACKILLIEELVPADRVTLTVRYVLDGTTKKGQIFEDRHIYRWYLKNEGSTNDGLVWRITADELVEGTRVLSEGKSFREEDLASVGIDFKHSRDKKLSMKKESAKLKFDVIQHAPGGISAADYNSDGWPDVFFADGYRSRLYRNERPGEDGSLRFLDVTKEAGLDNIDQATSATFADMDNDGDADLFITRYLASNLYYRNTGDGKFVDETRKMNLDLVAPSMSATLLDYNDDGLLDIYVGCYGDAFQAVPRLPFFAQNGEPNRLYRNDGPQGFTDVSAVSRTDDTGWTLAVASVDYDDDGLPDIGVANDFGTKRLFRNLGNGAFDEVAGDAGVLDISGGMGITFGDFDDDGHADIYTSNIQSNQRWFGEDRTVRFYLRNVLRTRWAILDFTEYWKLRRLLGPAWKELGTESGEGNSLLRNSGDGTFHEIENYRTNVAGWSWSVAFFDYDNDMDLDMYAANGWISNSPGTDL